MFITKIKNKFLNLKTSFKIIIIIYTILSLILLAFVSYISPNHVLGTIVKTENKKFPSKNDENGAQFEDVYLVFMNTGSQAKPKMKVFRNQDTAWYFKFNSSDIHAKASFHVKDNASVALKYYCFRIQLLSKYPNILSMEASENKPINLLKWLMFVCAYSLIILGALYIKSRIKNV